MNKLSEKLKKNKIIIVVISIVIIIIVCIAIVATKNAGNINTSSGTDYSKKEDNNIESEKNAGMNEGVIITLNDAQFTAKPSSKEETDLMVHSTDLKELITLLINGGARDILINDNKVQQDSIIECCKDDDFHCIKIEGVVLNSPYTMKAIGDSNTLYERVLTPGSYYKLLEVFNIPIEIEKI